MAPKAIRTSLIIIMAFYAFIFTFTAFYFLLEAPEIPNQVLFAIPVVFTLLYAFHRIATLRRETFRITVGEGYPIISERSIKKIKILNRNGDAIVNYMLICRNMSGGKLKKLFFEYPFDGKLETLEAWTNGDKTKASAEIFAVKKRVDGIFKPRTRLPNTAKVTFHLEEMDIEPEEIFECKMTFMIKECFRDLFKGEYSTFQASIPTKYFMLALNLPSHISIKPDGLNITVKNLFEIEDLDEITHIRNHSFPRIFNANRTITWRIQEPKLAASYSIFFVAKEDR